MGNSTRHHHEHFDGTGYPYRLQGSAIPLSGRLACLADTYDGLRSRRAYRPAVSHQSALRIMLVISEGRFDPSLVPVFERCGVPFEAIYRELAN